MKTLAEFVQELKNNNFAVYTADEKKEITWCNFVKDDKIGYIQYDDFTGFSFSTKHKPNRRCGTGFQVHTEIIEPTIKHCIDCFVSVPYWSIKRYWGRNAGNSPNVIKYKSWEEYINTPLGSILKYRQL